MCPQRLGRSVSVVKRQFRYRKPICPFISSTFQDFQAEREILVKKVFPAVDALCRQRGTYCAPVDLRWGINDAQAQSGDVIRLCLDYVSRCSPFFLCLMGERYGSHRHREQPPLPDTYEALGEDSHWLDKNFMGAASGGYDWVLQETFQYCSITELEIIQAFLDGMEHAHFYFRQPDHVDELFTDVSAEERREKLKIYESESEYSKLKVRDMKAKIVKKGLPVRYFRTPEDLAGFVLQDWRAVVDSLYPPLEDIIGDLYSERFAEWMAHETYAETRRRAFVRFPDIDAVFKEMSEFAEKVLEPCEHDDEFTADHYMRGPGGGGQSRKTPVDDVLVLVGERGSGKTAVAANWGQDFTDAHPEVSVLRHHVGSSALSADVGAMMRGVIHDIRREQVNLSTGSDSGGGRSQTRSEFHHVCEAFIAALSQGPCVLIIDGIDELAASYGLSSQQIKELTWLPQPVPSQCRIVMTTVWSDVTYKVLSQRPDTRMIHLPPLSDPGSRRQVIEEHLAMHCKCLSNAQLDRIVSCKLSDRPLFLTVLTNELRVFGVNSRLDYHLNSYLQASSIRDLWSRIIQRWIKDYSWPGQGTVAGEEEGKHLTGWVADALRLISVSRNGLSQTEILQILPQLGYYGDREVTSFEWAQFRSAALDALFERPGGLLSFFHHHLKEAVDYTLLGAATPDENCNTKFKNTQSIVPKGAAPVSSVNPFQETPSPDASRKAFHLQLAKYFLGCCHCERRNDELPWQLEMSHDTETLCKVLGEPRLFIDLHGDGQKWQSRRLDLFHYWNVLKTEGLDAGATYTVMVDEIIARQAKDCSRTRKDVETWEDHLGLEDDGNQREQGIHVGHNPVDHVVSQPEEGRKVDSQHEEADSLSTDSQADQQLYLKIGSADSLTFHQVALVCRVVGVFLSELGNFEHAERMLLTAHQKLNQNYPLGPDAQHLLYNVEESLADVYFYQLKKRDATKWYHKALGSVERSMEGLESGAVWRECLETKGRLLDQLGNMKTFERQYGPAEDLLSQAERCVTGAGRETGRASVQHHMGILRMKRGQFVEAEMSFRQAITAREHWFGKCHPLVANVINDLAGLLCHPQNNISFDRYEAEALYRRALQIREQSYGSDHLLVATTLFHFGKLLQSDNSSQSRSETLHLLRRSLDIRTTNLGPDHYITRAVRRVLTAVEAQVNTPSRRRDAERNARGGRYSSMTWHDADLLTFQQQARARTAEAARARCTMGQPATQDSIRVRASLRVIPTSTQAASGRPPQPAKNSGDDCSTWRRLPASGQTSSAALTDGGDVIQESSLVGMGSSNIPLLRVRRERPRASYGRRQPPASVSDPRQSDPAVNKPQGPEKHGSCSSVGGALVPLQKSQPIRPRIVVRLSRPQTGPRMTSDSDISRPVGDTGSLSRADQRLVPRQRMEPGASTASPSTSNPHHYHRQNCHIPGRHTVDIHNSYSLMTGPHSGINSLLGPARVPREISLRVQHTSAWYHVPGRYPTPQTAHPAKRSQHRLPTRPPPGGSTMEVWPRESSNQSWDSEWTPRTGGGRVNDWDG